MYGYGYHSRQQGQGALRRARALDRERRGGSMMPLDADAAAALRTAVELAGDISTGRTSCVELLELFVRRSEVLNRELNAVVVWDLERARIRAVEADAALARGESWGPLHGIPMTVTRASNVP